MIKETNKIKCLRCKIEKLRKEFQRSSKEYKSCNDCYHRSERTIYECFKEAVKLFDGEIK